MVLGVSDLIVEDWEFTENSTPSKYKGNKEQKLNDNSALVRAYSAGGDYIKLSGLSDNLVSIS